MATWTYKQWLALIAGVVVFLIALLGIGEAALVVLGSVVFYYVGKYLDGEIDPEEIRARAQGRNRGM